MSLEIYQSSTGLIFMKSPSMVAAVSKNPSLAGGLFIYKVPFCSSGIIPPIKR